MCTVLVVPVKKQEKANTPTVKKQEKANTTKDDKSYSPPAIVESGAGLSMSKWKMTTSQAVSVRSASTAQGCGEGGFIRQHVALLKNTFNTCRPLFT